MVVLTVVKLGWVLELMNSGIVIIVVLDAVTVLAALAAVARWLLVMILVKHLVRRVLFGNGLSLVPIALMAVRPTLVLTIARFPCVHRIVRGRLTPFRLIMATSTLRFF